MKKLLICLTVLFSAFLFTNKASAMNFTHNGVNYTDEFIYNKLLDKGYDLKDYDYFAIHPIVTASGYIDVIAWNDTYPTISSVATYFIKFNYNRSDGLIYSYKLNDGSETLYVSGPGTSLSQTNRLNHGNHNNPTQYPTGTVYGFNDLVYNGTTYTFDEFDWSFLPSTNYNITFHLNGGIVTDSYESELERKAIIEEMKTIYNDDGILDEYPSINQDWIKLFINPSIEKIQNFFEKYLTSLDKQTKLLTLYEKILNKNYAQPIIYYEDYTISIESDKLMEYLINQNVNKDPMQFVGWYYDEKLTQKVEATDTIDSDKHFYAKYEYKNVEDFLNNINFNSYTFDENYQYAVISLNNQQNRDIYLGLDIFSTNLEVYKYLKNENIYSKDEAVCLTSIYSKNGKYYYKLSDSLDNNYEVLIIPKEKLKGNYNFLLSDNAYVTYTNDLKDLVIKDENGNDIHTDVEDVYNYYQDALLNGENDLLEIFKDLITNKDNNVFSYFNQVWNYMKGNKLFIYFMTLIIGSLVILIIKAASR